MESISDKTGNPMCADLPMGEPQYCRKLPPIYIMILPVKILPDGDQMANMELATVGGEKAVKLPR